MRFNVISLALAAAAVGVSAQAQNVGVSVQVNQPGLYGRVDIGQVSAPPVVVYAQPVVIVPGPVAVYQRPIYLHVPPGHAAHWARYCARYNACGQPVYFVRDDWYQQHVVVHRRIVEEERIHEREHDHGHGHRHERGDDRR